MPVLVTEFGVPSALGSAHAGPAGRDQGGHSEQDALAIDADTLRLIKAQGISGGFVFAWTDEWFKRTWNTLEHQIPPDRRQLWHDPLTNEQYFGLVATDALGPEGAEPTTLFSGTEQLRKVTAQTDESSIHLRLDFAEEPTDVITIATSTQGGDATPPTGAGDADSDYAFELDPTGGTGQAWVRTDLDPTRCDGVGLAPTNRRDWSTQRLAINRSLRIDGRRFPVEYQEVGRLRQGVLDPEDPGYSGQAIWRQDGSTVRIRLPWAMTGLADTSSKQALTVGETPATIEIDDIGISVGLGEQTWAADPVRWDAWQAVRYRERLKNGIEPLSEAFTDLAP